jgi:hypothetical protein
VFDLRGASRPFVAHFLLLGVLLIFNQTLSWDMLQASVPQAKVSL